MLDVEVEPDETISLQLMSPQADVAPDRSMLEVTIRGEGYTQFIIILCSHYTSWNKSFCQL